MKKLVDVCGELKAKAIKEHSENGPDIAPFAELAKTDTQVGTLLAELSAATKPAVVEVLAAWHEADNVRLAAINAALSEANPRTRHRR